MKKTLAAAVFLSVGLPGIDAYGHNVRMTSNISPYLHLTRTEFLLNDSFPTYHKLVQPELARRGWQSPNSQPIPGVATSFSPYLHLTRKTVSPYFPIYQAIVQPTLSGQDGIPRRHIVSPTRPGTTSRTLDHVLTPYDLRVFLGSHSNFRPNLYTNVNPLPKLNQRKPWLRSPY